MNSCRELFHLISQSLLVQATVINGDKGPYSDETLAELTPTPLFRAQFKQITQTLELASHSGIPILKVT